MGHVASSCRSSNSPYSKREPTLTKDRQPVDATESSNRPRGATLTSIIFRKSVSVGREPYAQQLNTASGPTARTTSSVLVGSVTSAVWTRTRGIGSGRRQERV